MRTKQELESLLQAALDASRCGDDELLDRALIELSETESATAADAPHHLPKPFVVYVTIKPNKTNGLKETLHMQRVGPAASVEDARQVIARDKRELANSIGGLIPTVSSKGRTYFVLKANWEVVETI